MKSLWLAIQFLTTIPINIKYKDEKELPHALIFFPFVGLLLGLILAGINHVLFILNFNDFISNVVLVISLILLTGGIHLDGLADTFDALASRKNKEEMLEIMRDSHIGVMGVLSIVSILLLKISVLSSLSPSLKIISLILMCVLSRWALVLAMFLFPYARPEGKAKIFMQGINFKIFSYATTMALCCVIIIGQLKGLCVSGIIVVGVYGIGKLISKKINGITGDTLGAINELTEVLVLLSLYIFERGGL